MTIYIAQSAAVVTAMVYSDDEFAYTRRTSARVQPVAGGVYVTGVEQVVLTLLGNVCILVFGIWTLSLLYTIKTATSECVFDDVGVQLERVLAAVDRPPPACPSLSCPPPVPCASSGDVRTVAATLAGTNRAQHTALEHLARLAARLDDLERPTIVNVSVPLPDPVPCTPDVDVARADGAPACRWQCDDPVCGAVCEARCAPPACALQCTPGAAVHCAAEPVACQTRCPPDQTGFLEECPRCETVCAAPSAACAAHCAPVCEATRCDWACRAPEHCRRPQCALVCEAPACDGTAAPDAEAPVPVENE